VALGNVHHPSSPASAEGLSTKFIPMKIGPLLRSSNRVVGCWTVAGGVDVSGPSAPHCFGRDDGSWREVMVG
jgi:hypothetical protein